ncbi:hypothetical protein HOB76_07485 [Candidatus Woesearchaeota archaeon]|nr:hypothetical protein [Candidatus Woesearchaeota archaeon]
MFLDLIYPLEVRWGKDGELVTRIDRFSSELPFNFMDVFGVAFALSQSLTATQSLEDATMHALVLYSGLDSDKLPPFSADSVNGEDKVTWSLEKSKKMIKDVLMLSVNMFQVEGLRDSELIDVPGSPGLLKPFLFDLFQDVDILDHINVEFIYLDWPVYSNIWPADDDKLVPKTIKGPDFFDIITGDETYKYRFFYDLSYPVLIRVILEDIPFKDGRDSYSFYFAHEVSLRRNLNLFDYLNGQGRVPLNPGDVEMGTELVEEQIRTEMELSGEEEFLEELDSELMTDKAKDSLICNEEQRIGPERTFVVYDKYTNAPISNADVQFTCGRYVTCKWDDLNTELDLVTNLAETTTNLPMCRGEAFMVFSKEGYVKNRVKVNVDYPDDAFTQYVEMSPIVNVEIVDIDIIPALNFSGKRALADDELISIKFQRVTEYTDDDRLATSLIIRNDQPILSLPLAPGLWKVEGSLVDEAGYYIDATRRCDCGSDDEMMDICEREKETLRTGVPENCKVDTVMEDGAAVKVCGCLHINGSVDSEALDICDGVKDTKLWFFENGSDSAYADCEVVQDYVANFTHVGPNAEVGGVYFTGINRSVYWNVSYNSLVTHRNGLIIKIVDFPRPENDNEIDMLNMRGKFENYGAYAHYSRPYFS